MPVLNKWENRVFGKMGGTLRLIEKRKQRPPWNIVSGDID